MNREALIALFGGILICIILFGLVPLWLYSLDALRTFGKKRCVQWVHSRGGEIVSTEEHLLLNLSLKIVWEDQTGERRVLFYRRYLGIFERMWEGEN